MKKIAALMIVGFVMTVTMTVSFVGRSAAADSDKPYDEDTYGPEAPIVWNKPLAGVTFSHKVHTMDAGLDCESCHDDLFTMEAGAAEKKDDFTMATMSDGMYCGACHDGSTAFDVNSQCSSCHQAPKQQIVWTKPVKAVVFDHANHSPENGIDCESCHDGLFVMKAGAAEEHDDFTMASLYDGMYCGACHDGSTAFASNTRCTTCHIGVRGHARLSGEKADNAHHEQAEH